MGSTNRAVVTEDLIVRRDLIDTLDVAPGYEAVLYRDNVLSDRIYGPGVYHLGKTTQKLTAALVSTQRQEMTVETTGGNYTLRYFFDIPYDVALVLQFELADLDLILGNSKPKVLLHDAAMDAVLYAQRLVHDTFQHATTIHQSKSLKNELSTLLRRGIDAYFQWYTEFAGLRAVGVVMHEPILDVAAQQSIMAADKMNHEARTLGVPPIVMQVLKESKFSPESVSTFFSNPTKLAEKLLELVALRPNMSQEQLDTIRGFAQSFNVSSPMPVQLKGDEQPQPVVHTVSSTLELLKPEDTSPYQINAQVTEPLDAVIGDVPLIEQLAADLERRGLTLRRSLEDPANERFIVDDTTPYAYLLHLDRDTRQVTVDVRQEGKLVSRKQVPYEGPDKVYEQIQRVLSDAR